jgi:hypothetical protein
MQWGLMDARLKTHRSFEASQRGFAIQLTGRLPGDLFRDPVVMTWNRAYLGGLRGAGGFTAAQAANILMFDRPPEMTEAELERRLELVVKDLPPILEGHALLKQYVREAIDELTERRELIELREGRDRARAVIKARVDYRYSYCSPCYKRYQSSAPAPMLKPRTDAVVQRAPVSVLSFTPPSRLLGRLAA